MKGSKGGGAVSLDPQWSGEGGTFLAAFTETKENSSFHCLKLNLGIRPPLCSSPRGSLYLAASQHTSAGKASLPLLCPTSKPRMQQGLERVKNCSAAGEVLQPLQPLLLPAAVPFLTFGPPAQKKQDKMVLCAIPVCKGVEQLPLA